MTNRELSNGLVRVTQIEGKGRGVVAEVDIEIGTVVLVDPVLIVDNPDEVDLIDRRTSLRTHALAWRGGAICFAMGWSGLINHTRREELHNVTTSRDYDAAIMRIVAMRDIAAGEELLFDYEVSDEDLQGVYGIPLDA